jgi:Spy/CpxP family protein refolding chaperone
MNRTHRITLAALLAGAALVVAGASWAQDPSPGDPPSEHRGDGPRGGPMFMQHRAMIEKLNLTDEQSKKLEDIRYQHQKKAITMRADLESARLDLGRLMRADTPDRPAIEAQIDRVGQRRTTLEKDRVARMLEMRAVLTPEQLKIWRESRGGMRGMHGAHPGMMHGSGGPGAGGSGESMMLGDPMGDPMMGDPGMDAPDSSPDEGPGRTRAGPARA